MDTSQVTGIILAAGRGTRMQSEHPKVLHKIAGQTMLEHVVTALENAGIGPQCLVIGKETEPFTETLAKYKNLAAVIQKQPRGTGDAVASTAPYFPNIAPPSYADFEFFHGSNAGGDYVLICAGDVPGLNPSVIRDFVAHCQNKKSSLGVIGIDISNPHGYGRIQRDTDGGVVAIVEQKDTDKQTAKITCCNTGIVYAETKFLFKLLGSLNRSNSQQEYYLTDCFALAHKAGQPATVFCSSDVESFLGVNTQEQLAHMERSWMMHNTQART